MKVCDNCHRNNVLEKIKFIGHSPLKTIMKYGELCTDCAEVLKEKHADEIHQKQLEQKRKKKDLTDK